MRRREVAGDGGAFFPLCRERRPPEHCPIHVVAVALQTKPTGMYGDGSPQPQSSGSPDRLKRWGGIITGFAYTYSRALQASRAEIIEAVDGDDALDTVALVNGHRGTDHAGEAPNRIRSKNHPDCDGVDRIFIAVTPEQFDALARRVGASVERQRA